MPLAKIDTAAEEYFISDTLARIKKQFRPLLSVKARWYIHRILPIDTVLVEWKHRGLQELEIDIAQSFSSRDVLEQILWHELCFISDQIDPLFEFSHSYVQENYGPDSPRQRYYQIIKTVWCVHVCGRLNRLNLPCYSRDNIHNQFILTFGNRPEVEMWFTKLITENKEYTFGEIEQIARTIYRLK